MVDGGRANARNVTYQLWKLLTVADLQQYYHNTEDKR